MNRIYKTPIWQIRLPNAWHIRDDARQAHVSIFRPDGVGMLTVLTAENDLKSENQADGGLGAKHSGPPREHTYAGKFRRVWTFSFRGRTLYLRYTCAAHNAD